MDNLKLVQDDSFKSSTPDIEHTQRESTNTERDRENLQDAEILDLLQLDDISPEDELDYTCGEHPMHVKKSLHIKIVNKNRDENATSCDPFNNEEDIDSIEVQKEIKISEDKFEKKILSEAIGIVSQISNSSSPKEFDKEIQKIYKKDRNKSSVTKKKKKESQFSNSSSPKEFDKKNTNKSSDDNKNDITNSSWIPVKCTNRTLLLSSEKVDELMNALIFSEKNSEINTSDKDIQNKDQPNVCSICGFESDNVKERIEHLTSQRHRHWYGHVNSYQRDLTDISTCRICGFFCNKPQERIEHVFGSRHIGVQEAKKAIMCGVFENYTTDTFYCTLCSWFVTDLEPLTEHILSTRHKKAAFISFYKIFGQRHNNEILTTNGRGEVYCSVCKFIIKSWSDIDEIYDHLKINHVDEKDLPDNLDEKCSLPTGLKGKLKDIFDKKKGEKNMDTQMDDINNENESKIPSSPIDSNYENIENICRIKTIEEIFEKDFKAVKNNVPDKPKNNISNYIGRPLHYEHIENEYRIKTTEEIFEKNMKTVEINIPDQPKNDISNYINHEISDGSKSLKRRYGSSSPTNDSGISNTKIPIGTDPIKQLDSNNSLEQTSSIEHKQIRIENSNTNLSDLDSDDELEELNIITSIVKLLRLCDLLGNLGYFFEITLNKALEKKEFTNDVLDILKEPANMIIMEVILKKLKTFEKSFLSMRIRKEFIKGIMYLTYLIDASNSSQSRNNPRDFSLILDRSSLSSVRSSTEIMASNWPSGSSKNLELCHGLSVKEIAEGTVGKNVEFTIDFIKNSLQNIKRTSTLDVISDIALAVSAEHFKMLSDL